MLEGAQYAGECAKTFGHCLTMKLGGNINDLAIVKEIQELRYPNRPKPEQAAPASIEPKYNGVMQEWCAKAGCKLGDLGFTVMQVAITHKIGSISSGLKPPTILNPGGVAVQGAVAEGITAEQVVRTGIIFMDGGSDQIQKQGTGIQQPPQQESEDLPKMTTEGKAAEKTIQFDEIKATLQSTRAVEKTTPPVHAADLTMSESVKNRLLEVAEKGSTKGEWARPYMREGMNLIVDEIIAAGIPQKDQFVKNGLKWLIDGSCNGKNGIWELVVDLDKNEIIHFVFNSK